MHQAKAKVVALFNTSQDMSIARRVEEQARVRGGRVNLDDQLRGALRREPGPVDLAEQVMVRIADAGSPRSLRRRTRPTGRGRVNTLQPLLTVAACALIAIAAARLYVVRGTADEAARATTQVRLALEIASEKLVLVQRRVQESQP